MKKYISLLLLQFLVLSAFSQTPPDTTTAEKKARYKITRIRDNTVRAITPADFRNAFKAVADLAVKRAPYLTISELRAGQADTARVVNVVDGSRSGTFVYSSTSNAADDSAMVIRHGNRRYIRQYEFVRPEYFGAVGDGVTDDAAAINKAIAFQKGDVKFSSKTYAIGSTIKLQRGVRLVGTGNRETIANRSTRILLKTGSNCEMLNTPFVRGEGRTHYMELQGIFFDGNGNNQTVANVGINFQGVWVTSGIKDVFITDTRGTALAIGNGSDLHIENLWISGAIIEDSTRYAMEVNKDVNSPDLFGLIYAEDLYIENIRNKVVADPRNVQADRGNALLIRRANTVNILDLHLEGVGRMVDLADNDLVNIVKLSTAHCGRSIFTDGAVIRSLSESSYVSVGGQRIYNTIGNRHQTAAGFSSNEFPTYGQTATPGSPAFSLASSGSGRVRMPKTDVLNELRVMRGGGSSPQTIRVQASSDPAESSFIKATGRYTDFGTNYGNAGADQTILRLDSPNLNTRNATFFGNVSVAKQVEFTPVTGSFETANMIGVTSLTSQSAGAGPGFARVGASQSGVDFITTVRRASTAPNAAASYLGQFWLNTATGQYYVSVAVGSTTPADDWKIMHTETSYRVGASLDFPATATATSADLTVSVPGAVVGDFIQLGAPNQLDGVSYRAFVSAPDTVTVRLRNDSGVSVDPAVFTFRIYILK